MSSFMSPNFVIGSIRIGSVESASCINMGNNWPTSFESNQKTVQGFGSVEGNNNQLLGTRSFLNDSDFLDMLNLNESAVPEWLQNLIVQSTEAGAAAGATAGSGSAPSGKPAAEAASPGPAANPLE